MTSGIFFHDWIDIAAQAQLHPVLYGLVKARNGHDYRSGPWMDMGFCRQLSEHLATTDETGDLSSLEMMVTLLLGRPQSNPIASDLLDLYKGWRLHPHLPITAHDLERIVPSEPRATPLPPMPYGVSIAKVTEMMRRLPIYRRTTPPRIWLELGYVEAMQWGRGLMFWALKLAVAYKLPMPSRSEPPWFQQQWREYYREEVRHQKSLRHAEVA